jgi:hypothetical protein
MTAQIPEKLIYKGEITSMAFCPPLPWENPRIIKADDSAAKNYHTVLWRDKIGTWQEKNGRYYLVKVTDRDKPLGAEVPSYADWEADIMRKEADDSEEVSYEHSTACWRQYVGTWEIKDGQFFLVKLKGQYRLSGEEPLFADWFTGVLRIHKGEVLQYVHMGFGSVFEEEVHVKIEKGLVTKTKTINNRGKTHNEKSLAMRNLPSMAHRFPGDDEL